MKPNKVEQHIKTKLEQRTITPSPQSWNKLSDKLDLFETKKRKANYWWLAVAATVVLGIFAGFSILNNPEKRVENKMVKGSNQVMDSSATNNKSNEVISNNYKNVEDESQLIIDDEPLNQNRHNEVLKVTPINTTDAIIQTEITNVSPEKNNDEAIDFEAQKLLEVVAQIKQLNDLNNQVTEAEVDSLLKAAQKDIFKQKWYSESNKTVDANALLLEVEDELNGSFKAKVYEALKSGFISVKTAVAERKN